MVDRKFSKRDHIYTRFSAGVLEVVYFVGHRERHRYTITLSSDMRACEGSSLEIKTKLFCRWIDLIIAFMCCFAFLRLPSSNLYNGSFYKLQMCFCIVIPLSKISNRAQLRCVGIPYSSSEKKCSLHVYHVDSYCARMKKDLKKKSWRKSFSWRKTLSWRKMWLD